MVEEFLAAVTSPERPRIDAPVLLVVAHPDDETLGCGGLLPRLERVRIVHVTDGAPRSGEDAARAGFGSPAAYAAERRRELEAAVAVLGIGADRLVSLDLPDQGVAYAIADIARRLAPLVAEAEIVLTHAVEGGHPDHDATAVAAWAAARLAPRAPPMIEFPLYRADPDASDGWRRQAFGRGEPAAVLGLTAPERERKAAALAAYATQAGMLADFGAADEPFRPAGAPAFGLEGAALYDRYGWGVGSAELARLAAGALDELGLSA